MRAPAAPKEPKAPKLPRTLYSQLGPIKVSVVNKVVNRGNCDQITMGQCDPIKRTIRVLRSLHPWARHQAMWHEWMHMVIFDCGLHNAFSESVIETICDMVATALTAEMKARLANQTP